MVFLIFGNDGKNVEQQKFFTANNKEYMVYTTAAQLYSDKVIATYLELCYCLTTYT